MNDTVASGVGGGGEGEEPPDVKAGGVLVENRPVTSLHFLRFAVTRATMIFSKF